MKLLFVTTRFPYPPIKGDQVVSYHRLRILSRRHQITLLSFYDHPDELKYVDALRDFCDSIHVVHRSKLESLLNMAIGLIGTTPLQVLYYKSVKFQRELFKLINEYHFDMVHGVLLRLSPYFESLNVHGQPILLEIVDSMQLNLERNLILERGWKRILWQEEFRRMKKYEPRIIKIGRAHV